MEAISIEEIERMEDFIFHLSDSQMIEWKANLKDKQPFIFNIFTKLIPTNKTNGEEDFLLRMLFVVLKCFDVYGIELPYITEKESLKYNTKWRNTRSEEH